nr:hypothetical protein Iba_chr14cCG7850 [Ipomoea batatas]
MIALSVIVDLLRPVEYPVDALSPKPPRIHLPDTADSNIADQKSLSSNADQTASINHWTKHKTPPKKHTSRLYSPTKQRSPVEATVKTREKKPEDQRGVASKQKGSEGPRRLLWPRRELEFSDASLLLLAGETRVTGTGQTSPDRREVGKQSAVVVISNTSPVAFVASPVSLLTRKREVRDGKPPTKPDHALSIFTQSDKGTRLSRMSADGCCQRPRRERRETEAAACFGELL